MYVGIGPVQLRTAAAGASRWTPRSRYGRCSPAGHRLRVPYRTMGVLAQCSGALFSEILALQCSRIDFTVAHDVLQGKVVNAGWVREDGLLGRRAAPRSGLRSSVTGTEDPTPDTRVRQ